MDRAFTAFDCSQEHLIVPSIRLSAYGNCWGSLGGSCRTSFVENNSFYLRSLPGRFMLNVRQQFMVEETIAQVFILSCQRIITDRIASTPMCIAINGRKSQVKSHQ